MAGNTAAVDRQTLRIQWDAYLPMAAICQHWTITIDQLVRLRDIWDLEPRNDRRRRYKPKGDEKFPEPDSAELAASEGSLNLAPFVAARVTCVQVRWDAATREERQVQKATPFRLARIEVPEELREFVDDLNDGVQW